jgi:predicted nicotinamide N-methyase
MELPAAGPNRPLFPGATSTEYSGAVVVANLAFNGRNLRLVRPAEPDRLLDDPVVHEWNRRDDYMPYWAYLWPAALLLAEAVAREDWPQKAADSSPFEALEIGCGLGLAGLVALTRGLRVLFTDYDPAPLEFVSRSAAENGFDSSRFATRLLDWRALPDERFSLILGADVIYEAPLVTLVANLLASLLAPGGLGLIASPNRAAASAFPTALASVGLTWRAEPAASRTEAGDAVTGTIYRITRSAP